MAHSHSSSFADDYYARSGSEYSRRSSRSVGQDAITTNHELQHEDPTVHTATTQSLRQTAGRKQATLSQISVPSFSAFRNQASSIPVSSPSTVKRKQQLQPSPRAASFSLAEKASPRFGDPGLRPLSLDSPLPQRPNALAHVLSPPLTEEPDSIGHDRRTHPAPAAHDRTGSIDSRLATAEPSSPPYLSHRSSIPIHTRYAHEHTHSHAPRQSSSSLDFGDQDSLGTGGEPDSPIKRLSKRLSTRLSMHYPAPSMTLQLDGVQRTLSNGSLNSDSPFSRNPRPKSPGGRLGTLFGWKSSSQRSGTESPTTTFSDRSLSPLPSPRIYKTLAPASMAGSASTARLTPQGLDVHKANSADMQYFDNPETPILLGSPGTNAHVKELEKELSHISTELAESIKREMELEDEIDRLRADMPLQAEAGRRSSDYFSDSGSSARFPVTDPEAKMEQMEHKMRKIEQEKAQLKNEVASRLATELSRRRDLEQLVQNLEDQLQKRVDGDEEREGFEEHLAGLQMSLDDTRRRLSQERQAKDSFGELYSATRTELAQHKNERDNLRDEVVPGLQFRVQGLEAQAGETQALRYENSRLLLEVQGLREEVVQVQAQAAQGGVSFGSIAEESDDAVMMSPTTSASRAGLTRSGSVARSASKRGGSLTRSGSVKERGVESGRQRSGSVSGAGGVSSSGALSLEGIKEIEDQRDALHHTLRLLISRHERQRREHARAMKKVTEAREKAEGTPKRTAYRREVSVLKEEVVTLRKRTEDALEGKWQYEKGLGGLKMDLDRAELETRGLRVLLRVRDPDARRSLSSAGQEENGEDVVGEETLARSIETAERERDQARESARAYRLRAGEDENGASELLASADRLDELAELLEKQVRGHVALRERLANAVATGEREQEASTTQIEAMQRRLQGMEDGVLAAQQHSETTLGTHEADVLRIAEASSPSLQRLRISIPDASKGRFSPRSPMFPRSPRVGGGGLSELSLTASGRTRMLERKVLELEGALREAEDDVKVVVGRVTRSQMEVAELQGERDAAVVQMRKLRGLVEAERERVEGV